MSARRTLLGLILTLTLSACASRQALFTVLPNPDGSAGAITVDDGQKSVTLDSPYSASEIVKGRARPVPMDHAQIDQIFGSALAARPILPSHFTLYFENNTDILTPDSQVMYQSVFTDISKRPVYEVEVIGHTDTTGELNYNQTLSLTRAIFVRQKLAHDGLDAKSIAVTGRGPLDLRVKTGPNVAEQLNRRVEITVR